MAENETPSPSVDEAWAAVQGDVLAVRKDQQVTAGPARFNFRGIDGVMNAVGPALRRHGVHVRPINVDVTRRDVTTSGGKPARETAVVVTYRVTGPAGDSFDGMAPGESLDNGDKGTAKAMSVAYRTFLLQALTIPTDEPDPDSTVYQREAVDWTPQIAAAHTDDELRAVWDQMNPTEQNHYGAAVGARRAQINTKENEA